MIEARRIERDQNKRFGTHQEFLSKMRSLDLRFTVLEKYVDGRTRLLFLCAVCEQEFKRMPKSIFIDDACHYCKKLNEIKQKAKEKYGDEYEILGIYVDSATPIKIRHNVCNSIFHKTSQAFLKSGCPGCSQKERSEKLRNLSWLRRKEGIEKFHEMLLEFEQKGYTFAGESCEGFGRRNAFLCSHCGEIWWTTAYSILNGRNHICVSPCKKKTHLEYAAQVYELVNDEYSVLTEYCDAFTKVKMRHNVCGLEYLVAPAHFTSTGRRCPICTKFGDSVNTDSEQLKEHFEFTQNLHAGLEQSNQLNHNQSSESLDYLWKRKLNDAIDYHAIHGHIDIPYGHMVNGYNLGSWITEQRKSYRLGRLPQDRVDELNKLGMKWQYKEENWRLIY